MQLIAKVFLFSLDLNKKFNFFKFSEKYYETKNLLHLGTGSEVSKYCVELHLIKMNINFLELFFLVFLIKIDSQACFGISCSNAI